ncbi:ligase-associated DNA damage response endonuclease PdeM [Synechococcus sp. CS-1325]|uniref:ligase-associated DNA damage response endonuclease PdeM n=1 Tax=unclassified Synechococcus TaxID=2626047 RepID=UPI000DB1B58F|nr:MULTISPECIES: ligase-associated DNA damage response endonuclease PdeM [unclassified Synechococcus]MCT0198691.1 ligase-associated DNA damage response endonuclease PdeM [Synechococcus sp. CS-1325]MCT0229965.1 ligase-associated DNA damage response endonuclease PdeM [Synechococcus sp. CS-1324]PZU97217.1 MAG: serine/threonine protein phosphatase [Cyanobium sp.]PZV02212.1 MAG: serine/threonine protein phosphatase [Cyanobium sp.]
MPSHHPFVWRGHRLELLAAKAIWDPAQGLLLLADLHLGKAETFQIHGIPLPSDGDLATLNALLALAHHWRPREVVLLGDLIHSRLGLTAELRQKLAALPELLGCRLSLIGGNHERGSWLEGLAAGPSGARGPLWLSHAPERAPAGGVERLNLCGHLHPVAVVGSGADRLRLPCFSLDPAVPRLVLPAFGQLTGGHPCDPHQPCWLVADGSIVAWPGAGTRGCRPGNAPHRPG